MSSDSPASKQKSSLCSHIKKETALPFPFLYLVTSARLTERRLPSCGLARKTSVWRYAAPIFVQVVVVGIIIPVAEEMMFRGVLYRRYRETKGFYYAALWSSVFFSVTHLTMIQTVYAFLLGILLCYVYEKYGSVKAAIGLHICLNTGSILFTGVGLFRWLAGDLMRMGLAIILSAFFCSVLFVMIQKIGDPVMEKKPSRENDEP